MTETFRGLVLESIEVLEHALMNVRALTGGDERRMTALLEKLKQATKEAA